MILRKESIYSEIDLNQSDADVESRSRWMSGLTSIWPRNTSYGPKCGTNVGGFCFVGSCILPYKGNTFTWGVKSLCFIFRTFTVESQSSRRKSSKICLSFYLMRYSIGVMDRKFKSFESYGNVKWQGGGGGVWWLLEIVYM